MTVSKTRKGKWNGFRPVLGSEQLIGVSPGSFCLWYTVGQEDHRCQQQQFWAHLEKLKQAGEIWENICSNKETALPLSHKSETQRSKEWQVTFELIWCSNTQYVWQDWQGDPVHLCLLQHPTHPFTLFSGLLVFSYAPARYRLRLRLTSDYYLYC